VFTPRFAAHAPLSPHLHLPPQMTPLLEMEHSGLIALMRDDKFDDLGRLYCLMRRVDNGLATVCAASSSRLAQLGT
jgi:cullin 3